MEIRYELPHVSGGKVYPAVSKVYPFILIRTYNGSVRNPLSCGVPSTVLGKPLKLCLIKYVYMILLLSSFISRCLADIITITNYNDDAYISLPTLSSFGAVREKSGFLGTHGSHWKKAGRRRTNGLPCPPASEVKSARRRLKEMSNRIEKEYSKSNERSISIP